MILATKNNIFHDFKSMRSILDIVNDKVQSTTNKCITFFDYMNLVLYDSQQGYYGSGNVNIGSEGDFFTSSSLGPDFGELLAEQFKEMAETLGCSNKFTLIEVGAGYAVLASDILKYLEKKYPEFYQILDYIIIEESEALIKKQKEHLKHFSKIKWSSWEDISNNSVVGCIFSNELIDAFPVHQIIVQDKELKEVYVTVREGNIEETIQELSTSQLLEYFRLINIDLTSQHYPENYRTEVNLKALNWLETVSHKIKKGYLVTIDYGHIASKYYHPQRYQGTLSCYYQHRYHCNPYINLGSQDITAHVDFSAMEIQGNLLGLELIGLTQQELFFINLGLGERLAELSSNKYKLSDVLARRDSLRQLIDPGGLGRFKVLIQGKGLSKVEKDIILSGLKHNLT